MNPAEIEIMVQSLKPFTVQDVGSKAWKDQRDLVEQLNVVSHTNAAQKKDDYVLSALISHEKLPVIINEVLVMEYWRFKVLPHIKSEILQTPAGVYMYNHYESILVNLMECLMYFEECVTGFGDDILELVEYHWRNVASLYAISDTINDIPPDNDPKKDTEFTEAKRMEMFERQLHSQLITTAMGSISCLWFIVDRLSALPMAVTNYVLQKNDFLVGFAQIIEMQPWLRREKGGKRTQKFKGGQFVDVSNEDALAIIPQEAHAWFIIHTLMCDRRCREKYMYTKYKKEGILRIKRFMHEVLVDQIPALVDVQRALEELSFMEPPSGTEEKFKASLIVEHVPRIRSALGSSCSKPNFWTSYIQDFKNRLCSKQDMMEDAQRYSKIFDSLYSEQLK